MAIAEAPEPHLAAESKTQGTADSARVTSPMQAVARGAFALLTTQPLTWATSLIGVALLPRYLGDVALGQVSLAFTLANIAAPVVSLGLLEYLSRSLASRSPNTERDASVAWLIMTVAAALAAVLLGLFAHVFQLQVGSTAILFAAMGQIVLTPTQGLLLTLLRGSERMGRFAIVSSLTASASALIPLLVLVAGGGVNGYALATLLVLFGCLVVSWRTSGIRLPRAGFTAPVALALIPAGLPFLGWNLTMQFYGQIDRIMLGLLAPVQVVGWYAAATRIIGVPVFIPLLIVTPLFPALTRCREDKHVFRHTLNTSLRGALLVTAPFCAATAAAAPVIPQLLGWPEEFNQTVLPMTILAPNLTIVAFDMMLGTALMALGRERKWLLVGVIAAVVNPSANVVAIPFAQSVWGNGSIGCATVAVITELVMLVGGLILIPRGVLDRALVSIAVRTLIAGGGFVVITRLLLGSPLRVELDLAIGTAMFIASLLVLRLVGRSDVRQVWQFATSLLRSRAGRSAQPLLNHG
ncbi:MAG: oligosaccharide flippase family protein [Chloroflexi bacterium]|nr:oligosaccharide flippase family protein [Chloroflexota bacterium]MBV9602697.1 oligosaccharide flippase family protein [Chloroflexota bacterium]